MHRRGAPNAADRELLRRLGRGQDVSVSVAELLLGDGAPTTERGLEVCPAPAALDAAA